MSKFLAKSKMVGCKTGRFTVHFTGSLVDLSWNALLLKHFPCLSCKYLYLYGIFCIYNTQYLRLTTTVKTLLCISTRSRNGLAVTNSAARRTRRRGTGKHPTSRETSPILRPVKATQGGEWTVERRYVEDGGQRTLDRQLMASGGRSVKDCGRYAVDGQWVEGCGQWDNGR